ncbi:hypothetical protein REPUB_Repub05bG0138300 [Reevesia pubescens]
MSSNTASASKNTPLYEVDECRRVLHVYSDGSIWRYSKLSFNVPVDDDGSVKWKDFIFDHVHNLQFRLYKPTSPSSAKLSIFYYIHGGGFCIGSRAWPNCQNYCFWFALELEAVVVSLDYCLAPENRLLTAIEVGFMVVKWLQTQALAKNPDSWLTNVADFRKVFISGDSAGAEEPKDAFLNLELIDRFWRLSVPIEDTTDHPLINSFGLVSASLDHLKLDPILVMVGGSDLLKDRAEEYTKRMKNWGKKIEYVEFEGQKHGFFTINPNSELTKALMLIIKCFITENSN